MGRLEMKETGTSTFFAKMAPELHFMNEDQIQLAKMFLRSEDLRR